MPTRKRYRILHDRPAKPSFRPTGLEIPLPRQSKIVGLIRGVIKGWLDTTPAFKVNEWRNFLIILDSVYNDKLAIIEFKEDHLLVNLPMPQDPYTFVTLSIKGVLGGRRLDYSDPDLHLEIKRAVNSAYEHHRQSGPSGHSKEVSRSRATSHTCRPREG